MGSMCQFFWHIMRNIFSLKSCTYSFLGEIINQRFEIHDTNYNVIQLEQRIMLLFGTIHANPPPC